MIELFSITTLISVAILTWLLFILNVYFNLPLNTFVTIFTIIVTFLSAYKLLKGKLATHPKSKKGLFGSEKIVLPAIIVIILTNFLLNWFWLPLEFDAITMYDYRARVFALAHRIQDINDGYHGSIPLFTSMGHTILYLFGFNNPKIFYSVLFILFSLLFYAKLNQKIGRKGALIGCLLAISTPQIFYLARIAYTNFAYLAYMGISLIYLSDYLKEKKNINLILFSILIAISSWIRTGTDIFFIFNLIILFFLSIKSRNYLVFITPLVLYLLINLPWYFYQYHVIKITTYESANFSRFLHGGVPILGSIGPILKQLFIDFTDIKFSGGVGILFLIATFYQIIKSRSIKTLNFGYIILLVNLIAWIALSLLTQTEFTDRTVWLFVVVDSMGRLFTSFMPLLIYCSLQLPIFSPLWKTKTT